MVVISGVALPTVIGSSAQPLAGGVVAAVASVGGGPAVGAGGGATLARPGSTRCLRQRLDDRTGDDGAAVVIAVEREVDVAGRVGRAGGTGDGGGVAELGADRPDGGALVGGDRGRGDVAEVVAGRS